MPFFFFLPHTGLLKWRHLSRSVFLWLHNSAWTNYGSDKKKKHKKNMFAALEKSKIIGPMSYLLRKQIKFFVVFTYMNVNKKCEQAYLVWNLCITMKRLFHCKWRLLQWPSLLVTGLFCILSYYLLAVYSHISSFKNAKHVQCCPVLKPNSNRLECFNSGY